MQAGYFNIVCIQRVTNHTRTDEHISVGAYDESPIFKVGVMHDRGSDTYKIIHKGQILHDEDEFDWAVEDALKTLGPELKLNEDEVADLGQILSIQDDADYDLDSQVWTYNVGKGGEILIEDPADNALLVNVYPFYNTTVALDTEAGTANDDDCVEHHEFCGMRTNPPAH